MKRVKTVGSMAVLALFAMALLGPSLAMAEDTALCKSDEETCESPVTHVHYLADDMEVKTSAMDYKCDALFLGDALEEGLGSPLIIHGGFTYTSCNNSCTRTEENGPAILSFLKTGPESAEVITEALVHVVCGISINCSYVFEEVLGIATGPLSSSEANGELDIVEQFLNHESGGIFCPKEGFLTALFVPLSATYISS